MKRVLAFFLASACGVSGQEFVAKVTFFREKSNHSYLASFVDIRVLKPQSDWARSDFYWKLDVDGRALGNLHTNHFVTVQLPPGRHELHARFSEPLIIDLKPGERVYIRPSVVSTYSYKTVLQVASCREAAAYVAKIQPAPMHSKVFVYSRSHRRHLCLLIVSA